MERVVVDNQMLLRMFYRKCGKHLPGKEKSRKILVEVVGTFINGKVRPEDFSEEALQEIQENLHDPSKRDELIIKALRSCGSSAKASS